MDIIQEKQYSYFGFGRLKQVTEYKIRLFHPKCSLPLECVARLVLEPDYAPSISIDMWSCNEAWERLSALEARDVQQ